MSTLGVTRQVTANVAAVRFTWASLGGTVERTLALVTLLVALVFNVVRPEAVARQLPLVFLAIAFYALFFVPGSVVLSWLTPAHDEGFCGAVVRSFLISFLLIALGTLLGLQFGLPAEAFVIILIASTITGMGLGLSQGRPAYLAHAFTYSWRTQTPPQRVLTLGVAAAAVGMALLLFTNGYPTGITPEEIIPARKIAELAPLAADRVMQRPGVAPTYLYPALTFGMALLARASSLDVLVVATNLTGPLLLLALASLVAFITAFFHDLRVAWVSVAVILGIIVADPAALTHDLGTFIPIPNRYGFAPAILLPTCFYLLWRALAEDDRGALVLVPLGILSTALVHARDAAHILIVVAGTGLALLLGDLSDRRHLGRLGIVLGVSVVLVGAYQLLQTLVVEHVATVTRGLRIELLALLQTMLHDPMGAVWGSVPKTVVSPVGDWRYDNYVLMTQIFIVVTRTWLPLGLITAGALLGRWAPWPLRAIAWTIAAALLMVRIPFVYTLVAAAAGDPDVGQLSALFALLSLPLVAAGAVALLDAVQDALRRVLSNPQFAAWLGVWLSVALALWWIADPIVQTTWRRVHLLESRDPDLLILSTILVALAASLAWAVWAARSPEHRLPHILGCLLLTTALVPIGLAWARATAEVAGDNTLVALAGVCLGACAVTGTLMVRRGSFAWAVVPPWRRSFAGIMAVVPILGASAVTLPRMLEATGPNAPRFQSLEAQLWGTNRAGNLRADPQFFYSDLRDAHNVQFSTEVFDYLRQSMPPLSMVYAPRNVLTGIAVTANQYIVYFGDVKLSTDFDYYRRFVADDKDLLFTAPPTESGRAALLELFQAYQVTHVLVTPEVRDQVNSWLPIVNGSGSVLDPVFDQGGYTFYRVAWPGR